MSQSTNHHNGGGGGSGKQNLNSDNSTSNGSRKQNYHNNAHHHHNSKQPHHTNNNNNNNNNNNSSNNNNKHHHTTNNNNSQHPKKQYHPKNKQVLEKTETSNITETTNPKPSNEDAADSLDSNHLVNNSFNNDSKPSSSLNNDTSNLEINQQPQQQFINNIKNEQLDNNGYNFFTPQQQFDFELIGRHQQLLQKQLQQPTSSLFQFPMFLPPPLTPPVNSQQQQQHQQQQQQQQHNSVGMNINNMNELNNGINNNSNINNTAPNIMDFFQKANIHGPPSQQQQPHMNNNNNWQFSHMHPPMPNFGFPFGPPPPMMHHPGMHHPFGGPHSTPQSFGGPPLPPFMNGMPSFFNINNQPLNQNNNRTISTPSSAADYFLSPANSSPIGSGSVLLGDRNVSDLLADINNNSRLPINELNQLQINEISNQFGSPLKVLMGDPLAKLETEAQAEAEEDVVNEKEKKKLEKYTKTRPLLPPPSDENMKTLTEHAYDIFEKSKCEENRGRALLIKLQNMVSKTFTKSEVKLHLFGSSANGMSLKGGDIDICMLVDHNLEGDSDTIISELATMLNKNQFIKVLAIPSARVPIVKFKDPYQNLSCDICINNKLAIYNTKLVSDYSAIDDRMRPLVYIVKRWAKRRKINEPFTGTLSSYAYINLVISFLQSRNPPVLPCLQELANGTIEINGKTYGQQMNDVIVDGYNCKYYNDMASLKGFGSANKETLGELVFGFFQTYARQFNYASDVVSIRTGGHLQKSSKTWESIQKKSHYCFSIEDPFEITHNLARVVKRSQLSSIIQEFNRAYKILSRNGNLHIVCREYFESENNDKNTNTNTNNEKSQSQSKPNQSSS